MEYAMSYHLVENHGTHEVWNESENECKMVKWFPTMFAAMQFISLCQLGEAFK